jgi:ribosome biogenesis protein MAK21
LYELTLLGAHYHPTVAKWAKALLQKQNVEYTGDPLLDFSLINFLDRFNYQQPKPKLVQRLKTHKIRRSLVEAAVNSKDFLLLQEDQVREEERFFHHFFKLRKVAEDAAQQEEEEEPYSEDDELGFSGELELQEESEEEAKPKKRLKKSVFSTADDYEHLLD